MNELPTLTEFVAQHHARGREMITSALREGREIDADALTGLVTWRATARDATLMGSIWAMAAVLNALLQQGVGFSDPAPATGEGTSRVRQVGR